MSKELDNDKFLTADDLSVKQSGLKEIQISSSLSNLKLEANKQQEYVNHPNCVPEGKPGSVIGQTESHDIRNRGSIGQIKSCDATPKNKSFIGQSESCDLRTKSLIGQVESCDNRVKSADSCAPKGKPPSGGSWGGNAAESIGARNRAFLYRSTSESHDVKNRGSTGSFGSTDSRTNEEEVIIAYRDEAVDITDTGAGNPEQIEEGSLPRLVIVSSKLRNTTALRHALQPNVNLVQYKYDSCTLEDLLGLIGKSLGEKKCESIALILSCSGLSIQLCGKDEKSRIWRVCTFAQAHLSLRPGTEISCAGSNNDLCTVYKNSECCGEAAPATTGILCNHQCVVSMPQNRVGLQVLTKENVSENQSVREFFSSLVTDHLDKTLSGARLDFLACNLMLHTDGGGLDKELESFVGVPVKLHKDLVGCDVTVQKTQDETPKVTSVGELYLKLDRLRGWSGQQQQTLAGFEKIQTVGKGAYGAAVLYRKKDDDSLVILKEINMHDLNASERQMALNEVNILAMLEHPNIISYFDSFEEDGVIMIEMEYADGGTLARFLSSQDKPLEEKEIVSLFQQIVAAITHIHKHNILHRDLKTANIFLTKEGVVKVGDFGISKMMSTVNKGANTVLGTPYYISPEMCEGKAYNDKSDIWALGCILYEMACLQKTFEGSNLPALVNKIMKGQFAPVKGNYSQEFKDLVMTMLNQDPSDRPSAHQLMYIDLPKLMNRYEESSDLEEDLTTSTDGGTSKKKTRSILYYFDSATANLTPVELMPKIKIRTTAVGPDHVIVVTTESQVYTWGDGIEGQLGHGDMDSRSKPELVKTLAGKSITRACCGEGFSVFVSDRGIVLTCGDGSKGCLGHGDWSPAYRPRLIESLLSVDVTAVACGKDHVVVVGSEGEVFAWGNGADGKLGLGNEEDHCQPMRVTVSEPVMITDVFCGVDGTMFLTDVGGVFACGCNKDNKLGLNNRHGFIMAMRNIFTRTEVEGQKVPTSVRNLSRHKVLDISMGLNHTAVIVEPGHVYTFGRNIEGQLGIGNTKPQNNIMEVKAITEESTVNRVQSGDHYTVASTHKSELLYWGLRFKEPGPYVEDSESKSSTNDSFVNKDDLRVESVTPRNATSHSRQTSISSVNSITSIPDKETEVKQRQGSQTSVDSSLSGLTDSGFTEHYTATSDIATRAGFRPLSSVPRRSTSASSREAKEKETETSRDDSEIIFPPNHLMRILPAEESLSLASFFCHGENLFVQLETTAPPPRRRSRKKRGIRKRYSGSTLPIPDNVTSASSREGGDEYSSEASEMDTQVPTWIQQELALSEMEVNDGNEADNTSDQSDSDLNRGTIDSSMSSIQINRDLTPCKSLPEKKPSPRGIKQELTSSTLQKVSPREVRPRSFSNSTTESEIDNAQSDGSCKDLSLPGNDKSRSDAEVMKKVSTRRQSSQYGYRAKSAANYLRGPNRLRQQPRAYPGHDVLLKEQLAARGFVSDVTVKRREEALIGELKMTREEKNMIEQRLRQLEEDHMQQQERLRQEAEQKALEREKSLQEQIQLLQQQLQTQNSQLKDHQKIVTSLQDQLTKVQKKKKKLSSGSVASAGTERHSSVCVIQ